MAMLSAAHRSMLEAESAIEPALIEQRGYRTVTDPNVLIGLGFSKGQANVPGLLIPIWGPHGSKPLSYQYRPDRPRRKDGKALKYESLPKTETRVDVPLAVRPKLGNPSEVLWITEGCKKADAAASKGLACIALTGVWNFKHKNEHGGSAVLGDFEHIPLAGRQVVICYDSDVMEKSSVQQALRRLRNVLLSRGATVRFCILPAEKGQKIGLDDFFAAGRTVDELQQWICDEPGSGRAVTLADVEAQTVEWLWSPYLPLGELTLLAGDGGVGKSYLAMAICRATTLGEALPGGCCRPPAHVLFVTDEDDISRTMKPRADLLGLDQSRFHVLDLGEIEACHWLDAVRENAKLFNVALIVLDPLQSFVEEGKDLNKTSDMRPLLRRLRDLAKETGSTVLVVTHVNKMTGGKAHYRVNGSVDLVNAVRSALMAGWVEVEGEDIQVLGHAKSNYAARGPSLRYRVSEHGFEWLGAVMAGVEDISAGRKTSSKLDEAADFLRDVLADGPRAQKEVEDMGRQKGHSIGTLQRAKKALGIKSMKWPSGWAWLIPEQDAQHVLEEDVEHLAPSQVQNERLNGFDSSGFEHLDGAGLPVGIERIQTASGQGIFV